MSDAIGKKIEQLRTALNEDQSKFAKRFGVEQPTVSRWENGSAVARRYQRTIAELAGMSVAEFFHSPLRPKIIPIVGHVSKDDTFEPLDDLPAQGDLGHVNFDVGAADQVGVKVRGNSMRPVYRNGDIVIGAKTDAPGSKILGKDCIVKTKDGKGYLKIVLKGSRPGLFRLRSYNPDFSDIEDVALLWVAPIIWVQRNN